MSPQHNARQFERKPRVVELLANGQPFAPTGTVAITGARVVTMEDGPGGGVIEHATSRGAPTASVG